MKPTGHRLILMVENPLDHRKNKVGEHLPKLSDKPNLWPLNYSIALVFEVPFTHSRSLSAPFGLGTPPKQTCPFSES